MDAPNLGPQWVWGCLGIAAFIGIITVIVGIIAGIVWCFNHIVIQ